MQDGGDIDQITLMTGLQAVWVSGGWGNGTVRK